MVLDKPYLPQSHHDIHKQARLQVHERSRFTREEMIVLERIDRRILLNIVSGQASICMPQKIGLQSVMTN